MNPGWAPEGSRPPPATRRNQPGGPDGSSRTRSTRGSSYREGLLKAFIDGLQFAKIKLNRPKTRHETFFKIQIVK